jgi:hypothetical protein
MMSGTPDRIRWLVRSLLQISPWCLQVACCGRWCRRARPARGTGTAPPAGHRTQRPAALVGEIRDQSHLYGVLDLVRGPGLDLVSVETNWETSEPGDKESAR